MDQDSNFWNTANIKQSGTLCKYFSEQTLKSKSSQVDNVSSNLPLMHINALPLTYNFDIVCVGDTWLIKANACNLYI